MNTAQIIWYRRLVNRVNGKKVVEWVEESSTYKGRDKEKRRAYMRDYMRRKRAMGASFSIPKNPEHGDISSNIAIKLSKKSGKIINAD